MYEHIKHSNLIELVSGEDQIQKSLEAWQYLVGQPDLTEEVVLTTHRMIMEDLLIPAYVGNYRHVWVTVGGRICPDPNVVPLLMEGWLTDMQDWKDLDPVAMHVEFEHIHPFVDGNGRCGRFFMWWHESHLGQEPTLIKFEERFTYYDLF